MTFEMAEAVPAAQDARIPMILIGDGAAFVPDAPRPGMSAAEAAPTLQQALAQTPPCGCGGRAAGPAEILSLPGAAELVIPEAVPADREPGYRRFAEGLRGPATAMWLIQPEAALWPAAPAEAPAVPEKLLRLASDVDGDGVEDPPIVVDGEKPTAGFDTGFWTDSGGGGDTGTPGGGDAAVPQDDIAQKVTIDDSVPLEEVARAKEAEQKLEEQMRVLDKQIQALADDAAVRVGDKTYTGAEIKLLWARLSIVITWGRPDGPLGTGTNNNGIYEINLPDLETQINNSGLPGYATLAYLFMYELSHLLPIVINYGQTQWNLYKDNGGNTNDLAEWQNSEQFANTERFTHSWAEAIAGATQVVIYTPHN